MNRFDECHVICEEIMMHLCKDVAAKVLNIKEVVSCTMSITYGLSSFPSLRRQSNKVNIICHSIEK